jgi:hypothetical protein
MIKKDKIEVLTERTAIDFLKSLNYTVLKPVKLSKRITDSQLIDFFYFKLSRICGSSFTFLPSSLKSDDLKALKQCQLKAEAKGIDKYHFNRDLMFVLKKMFDNFNKLQLTDLKSFNWLLSDKGSWVLRKVAVNYSPDYLDFLIQSALTIERK